MAGFVGSSILPGDTVRDNLAGSPSLLVLSVADGLANLSTGAAIALAMTTGKHHVVAHRNGSFGSYPEAHLSHDSQES